MTTTARGHDLPPLWDGRRVEWSPWVDEPHTTLIYHAPAEDFACTGCGWIRETDLHTTGRVYVDVPTWPVTILAVRRCPGCGLDEVTDIETGEVWDLEPEDYTDAGSWPEPQQGELF